MRRKDIRINRSQPPVRSNFAAVRIGGLSYSRKESNPAEPSEADKSQAPRRFIMPSKGAVPKSFRRSVNQSTIVETQCECSLRTSE